MSDAQTNKKIAILLQQIATDVRAIRKAVAPEDERPAATRKKDPRKLYGGNGL